MSSSLGTLFRVSTFGESHGIGVGAVVDGCPAGLPLSEADIQPQLDRRRPGQSDITTPREEADRVTILSGVENGLTLGTPIGLLVHNKDQRPGAYGEMDLVPRPSHADFTYQGKYGIRASSGGGRSSARETIGRVAAGAIAEKILRQEWGVDTVAWVSSVGSEEASGVDIASVTREQVDQHLSRCPDKASAARMEALVREVLEAKDSVGGVVSCVCRNLPVGWGEPVFDKLEAKLAQAMLSLPATKGFEIGSGFAGTRLRGSQHNDPFVMKKDRLGTVSNNAGGTLGGISSGEPVLFRVAFKPVATIGQSQQTVDFAGQPVILEAKGRHDPCVVPRAVPIVESMVALILLDLALRQKVRGA
jgi:chorismate synthase